MSYRAVTYGEAAYSAFAHEPCDVLRPLITPIFMSCEDTPRDEEAEAIFKYPIPDPDGFLRFVAE